jgi:hypothetical protein
MRKSSPEWQTIIKRSPVWFDPASMRFFNSRVNYASLTAYKDGWLFISSEQFKPLGLDPAPRRWTIRFAGAEGIETIGIFQAFDTADEAQQVIKEMVVDA